jgi:acetolactate synthase regulatory subunit
MSYEGFQIAARNHPRVMAQIATLLTHRRARVVSLTFTFGELLHADLVVEAGTPRDSQLLALRLRRLVDVFDVCRTETATAPCRQPG